MKCKKCGFENDEDSSFCINCGSPIEKIVYKKCIVCGSDIEEDALSCPKCGSVQDDYIKCKSCGEACLKTTKFCTSCGLPLYDDNISDINNIQNILDQKDDTSSLNEENKPIFEETVTQPVNTEPIVNVPNFEERNTASTNTTPIIDNTEIYHTDSFVAPKKSNTKIVIIIVSIILGLSILAVAVILVYKAFFVKDVKPITKKNVIVEQEVIDNVQENDAIVQDSDNDKDEKDNTKIVEEKKDEKSTVQKVTYYKLKFKTIVKIRTYPSVDDETNHIGKVSTGSELIGFDVYDDGNYTWYYIGHDEWVANDNKKGELLDVYSFESEPVSIASEKYTMYRVTKSTNIYSSPSESSDIVGFLSDTTLIKGFDKFKENGISWIKISPCEYVKSNDLVIEY